MTSDVRCTCGHFQQQQHGANAFSTSNNGAINTKLTNNNNPPHNNNSKSNNLDSSFVHLLSPSLGSMNNTKIQGSGCSNINAINNNNQNTPPASTTTRQHHPKQQQPSFLGGGSGGGSFLESHRHLEDLLRAAQGRALPHQWSKGMEEEGQRNNDESIKQQTKFSSERSSNDDEVGVQLCLECIERVASAIDHETERLHDECRAYQQAIELEEERLRAWTKAVTTGWNQQQHQQQHHNDNHDSCVSSRLLQQTIDSFQKEVELLQEACRQQEEEELSHLQALFREQVLISSQLDEYELQQAEEWNDLELQASSFDALQSVLTKRLHQVSMEVQALEQVNVFQQVMMIEWNISPPPQPAQPYDSNNRFFQQLPHSIPYPRVNNLRLAFTAISPHPDNTSAFHYISNHNHDNNVVEWEELEGAWSLVAQCVLWIAALTNFSSPEWRIVPLTNGPAKLIQYQQSSPTSQQTSQTRNLSRQQQQQTARASSSAATQQQQQQQPVVVVHNLGRPNMAKSLCAFQALLHQLIEHVMKLLKQQHEFDESIVQLQQDNPATNNGTPRNSTLQQTTLPSTSFLSKPPYPTSSTQVGPIRLDKLLVATATITSAESERNDHGDVPLRSSTAAAASHHYRLWSQAIYCMACNLEWLCAQTSSLVGQLQT